MIQLAIDPATRFLGYSIMDTSLTIGHDISKYGLIEIDNKQTILSDKILMAYDYCNGLFNQYQPDVLVLEDQFYSTKKPTIKDVIRVSGVIILAAKQKNLPVVMYKPQEIKLAVAKKGNAVKSAVADAVLGMYSSDGYVSLLEFHDTQTKSHDKTDDIFDSIAINLTHRFTRNGKKV